MMRLRRLQVEQMRKHRRPVEVRFGEELTVVYGPNEAGKSTLFTALEYAFFRRSGAGGSDLDRLAPWGTALAPAIELDFVYDDVEYRLNKRWGTHASTIISRLAADGTTTPDQDDGDDWLLKIFAGEAPGRGRFSGFRAAHRGLAHLLFAPQGGVVLRGPAEEYALNEDAKGRLAGLIGATTQTAAESAAIERIRRQWEASWTAGGRTGNSKRKATARSGQHRE
jgi:energy-coupling factor transporter ATP-binding protein EcfA2